MTDCAEIVGQWVRFGGETLALRKPLTSVHSDRTFNSEASGKREDPQTIAEARGGDEGPDNQQFCFRASPDWVDR